MYESMGECVDVCWGIKVECAPERTTCSSCFVNIFPFASVLVPFCLCPFVMLVEIQDTHQLVPLDRRVRRLSCVRVKVLYPFFDHILGVDKILPEGLVALANVSPPDNDHKDCEAQWVQPAVCDA